jgi:hypothetical protein
MLGALQTSGCVVQQCDVLSAEAVTGQVLASSHKATLDVTAAAIKALPKAQARPRKSTQQQGNGNGRARGLADAIRAIVDEFPNKHEFKRAEIIKPLREAGFSLDSISPGINNVLRSTRFERLGPGHYRVVNPKIPVHTSVSSNQSKAQMRPPQRQGWAVPRRTSGLSARKWLEQYIAGMPPGSRVTRQQLIQAGIKSGHADTSMNTAIATTYTLGKLLLRTTETGVYATPSQPVRIHDAPSGTTPELVTRHIEEEV